MSKSQHYFDAKCEDLFQTVQKNGEIDDVHNEVSLNRNDNNKLEASGQSMRKRAGMRVVPFWASNGEPAGRCEEEARNVI